MSTLELEIRLSREDGWEPLTDLTPPQLCTCHKPGPGVPTWWSLLCAMIWGGKLLLVLLILVELLTIGYILKIFQKGIQFSVLFLYKLHKEIEKKMKQKIASCHLWTFFSYTYTNVECGCTDEQFQWISCCFHGKICNKSYISKLYANQFAYCDISC